MPIKNVKMEESKKHHHFLSLRRIKHGWNDNYWNGNSENIDEKLVLMKIVLPPETFLLLRGEHRPWFLPVHPHQGLTDLSISSMMVVLMMMMMMVMMMIVVVVLMLLLLLMLYENNHLMKLLAVEVFWGWDHLRITAFPKNGDNYQRSLINQYFLNVFTLIIIIIFPLSSLKLKS